MKRRAFISLLGGAAVWPVTAPAQQGERKRHIGMLMAATESDMEWQNLVKVFIQRLQELGWTQDRNLKIDFRWAETGSDRLEALAKELVELKPELIISQATVTTIVLLQQTRTVPIIFLLVADPVGNNFVKSFSHPDTNATGFFTFDPFDVREMARTAQGDRARHRPRRHYVQPEYVDWNT
jgi:putative tryptophan/tyrosine transport system substrate-binding protein